MAFISLGMDVSRTVGGPLPARQKVVDKLWREFFSDPSQWRDNRLEKGNSNYPDFTHSTTQEGLWLDGKFNPPWVEAQLLTMTAETVKSTTFSWNRRLSRSAKDGQYVQTISLFHQMQEQAVDLNTHTFVPVLNACANLQDLEEGRYIHRLIMQIGNESDIFVGTCLVDMYAKCGSITDALAVFYNLRTRDVVSWNSIILGCVKCGQSRNALELYRHMESERVEPNCVTFVGLLNACASIVALEEGRRLHKRIIESGYESDVVVRSTLVDMYGRCGSVEDAEKVFDMMLTRDVVSWNTIIMAHVRCGQGKKALELFDQMRDKGMEPNSVTFLGVLNACASLEALDEGRLVHQLIIQYNCDSELVGNSLVDMYAKCGSMEDAWRVFDQLPKRDVVAWSAMILGYVKCGQGLKALEFSRQMQQDGMDPDPITFVGLLNACASITALDEGRRVHQQIIQRDYESDVYVGNSLVDMYSKCRSMEEAGRVFHNMPMRNVISWNTIILGYVKCGEGQKALELFGEMQRDGVKPNSVTFVAMLNACATVGMLEDGRRVHTQIIKSGCQSDALVCSSLIDMYAKCGSIKEASIVFAKTPVPDVASWNALILGLVRCGEGQKALDLGREMQRNGVDPNAVTFVAVLNACASVGALEEGRRVHSKIVKAGCQFNVFVRSSLIDMYSKCGSIEEAWTAFNRIPTCDVASWNAVILGHVKCGEWQKALQLFGQMEKEGVDPDPLTFIHVLNACATIEALEEGKHVHQQVIRSGCQDDILISNALVHMYAKCGRMEDAWSTFKKIPTRDLNSWNAIIWGYVKSKEGQKALGIWQQMCSEGVEPNPITFVGILIACTSIGALDEGRRVHQQIIQLCYEFDVWIGNSLIDMYVECGRIDDALKVFNKMPLHDAISWKTIISGLVKCGQEQKALRLAWQMQQEGMHPGVDTFSGPHNSCTSVLAFEEGKLICGQITERSDSDAYLRSCLFDMYAKCGSIENVLTIFKKIPINDIVCWNAMLGGYAVHGRGKEAVAHFERMCQEGSEMDGVTFISLLSACSRGGLLEEGLHYFESMSTNHSISVTVEHYTCVVDILGRSGHLHEAENLIETMPYEPNAIMWICLLGACRLHGNLEMAERVAKQILQLDSGTDAGSLLLANIYAASGQLE